VRFDDVPALDRYFLDGQFRKPLLNVRYSWDQDNDDYWDYKLGLLSDHTISNVVESVSP